MRENSQTEQGLTQKQAVKGLNGWSSLTRKCQMHMGGNEGGRNLFFKTREKLGVVAYVCNPSISKAEARGS